MAKNPQADPGNPRDPKGSLPGESQPGTGPRGGSLPRFDDHPEEEKEDDVDEETEPRPELIEGEPDYGDREESDPRRTHLNGGPGSDPLSANPRRKTG